jgi:hypothetical protein
MQPDRFRGGLRNETLKQARQAHIEDEIASSGLQRLA